MGLTIPRKWPGKPGDSSGHCSYCGARWLRSQLTLNQSGLYACPDDVRGRDEVQLDMLNAQAASEFTTKRIYQDNNAPYFKTTTDGPDVHYTDSEDLDI